MTESVAPAQTPWVSEQTKHYLKQGAAILGVALLAISLAAITVSATAIHSDVHFYNNGSSSPDPFDSSWLSMYVGGIVGVCIVGLGGFIAGLHHLTKNNSEPAKQAGATWSESSKPAVTAATTEAEAIKASELRRKYIGMLAGLFILAFGIAMASFAGSMNGTLSRMIDSYNQQPGSIMGDPRHLMSLYTTMQVIGSLIAVGGAALMVVSYGAPKVAHGLSEIAKKIRLLWNGRTEESEALLREQTTAGL